MKNAAVNAASLARTTLLYRYTFRKIPGFGFEDFARRDSAVSAADAVSQFGISWVRDTRDNPADATKGTLNSADFGVADTYFGSSASFTHFLFQKFFVLSHQKKRFSFARSIRIGVLNPYRDTVSLTFPAPTGPNLPQVIRCPNGSLRAGERRCVDSH